MGDQTVFISFCSAEPITSDRQFECPSVAHLAGEARKRVPAEGHAQFNLRNREPRRFARDPQVAAGSEYQRTADREALDGGDRDLVEALDRYRSAAADARRVAYFQLVGRP